MHINKGFYWVKTIGLFGAILAAQLAVANQQHSHDKSDSIPEYQAAMDKMMESMQAQPYTGNPDLDFATHMIPHHQGAIDTANVELRYGKDPELREMARNIIKAQEEEIKFLTEWLKKRAGSSPKLSH